MIIFCWKDGPRGRWAEGRGLKARPQKRDLDDPPFMRTDPCQLPYVCSAEFSGGQQSAGAGGERVPNLFSLQSLVAPIGMSP